MVEAPGYASSVGYISFPIKEVSSPRSEILSPDESRSSDAPPHNEMSSFSTGSYVSRNVMEGYSADAILKPGGGAVFFRACSFLPIWRDLLTMVTVSSSLPCARA